MLHRIRLVMDLNLDFWMRKNEGNDVEKIKFVLFSVSYFRSSFNLKHKTSLDTKLHKVDDFGRIETRWCYTGF